MSSSIYIIFSLSLFSLFIHPAFSQTTCKSLKLSSNVTFENCNDLPTLDAVLHWTYDTSKSSLSMAFTASPPQPDGWVGWGLNPTAPGMKGAQVLVAHKGKDSVTVDTYDLRDYHDIKKGPISYNVSSLSAEETSGKITVFGTWVIPKGESTVNTVWQVGPMMKDGIGKHAMEPANRNAVLKLSLTGAGAPGGSPAGSPSGSSFGDSAPPPGTGAGERLVSGVLALGAIVVSMVV
ncbi:auxin-induced in root cultures protein 12-like [Chenopodium quinoa]|uniref:auxin-induced in root cultures protein 12-like n=1 Tax=Chenopodium quinoa TaxID=63459 RepID=UPI000B793BFE|nr:auxin-induced in root cultures protein 12-like [Chenopodium quinoa]